MIKPLDVVFDSKSSSWGMVGDLAIVFPTRQRNSFGVLPCDREAFKKWSSFQLHHLDPFRDESRSIRFQMTSGVNYAHVLILFSDSVTHYQWQLKWAQVEQTGWVVVWVDGWVCSRVFKLLTLSGTWTKLHYVFDIALHISILADHHHGNRCHGCSSWRRYT